MLNKMSPFFVIIFSFLLLKEKMSPAQALAVAGAFIGSLFGLLALGLLAEPVSRVAIKFTKMDYFLLALFGLATVGSVSTKNYAKGLISVMIGLVISMIGLDPLMGTKRLTFGIQNLAGGVSTVPALVGFFASRISSGVAKQMRSDVFRKVESFSSTEFDKFSTASLITRTTNDVTQVQMLISMGLRLMCYAPIMGVGGIIFALQKSVSLSWIIALAVIVLLGLVVVLLNVAMPKFKSLQRLTDRLNLVSRENLSGMLVVRAFTNEKFEEARFDKANEDLTRTNRFTQRVMSITMPIMMLIMNLVTLLIMWVGGHAIAESTMQVGDMMAYIQYTMQIIMSFLMIAMIFIMVPRAMVSADRVQEVLTTELSIKEPENPVTLGNESGELRFDDVSFRYGNAEEDTLSHMVASNGGEVELRPGNGDEDINKVIDEESGDDDERNLLEKVETIKEIPHHHQQNHRIIEEVPHIKRLAHPHLRKPFTEPYSRLSAKHPLLHRREHVVEIGEYPVELKGVGIPIGKQ